MNLLFSIPYKWARSKDTFNTFENDGVEHISIGAKYRLSEDNLYNPVSLSLKLETPGGYDKDKSPSLGHGRSDAEARLMLGKLFNSEKSNTDVRWYHIGGEIGYRTRNNKIPYFLEIGLKAGKGVLLKGMVEGIIATSEINSQPTNSELIQKKYEEYSKFMCELLFSPNEVFGISKKYKGLTLGFGYGYTFYGKNTAVGQEVIFKLFYKF